MPATFRLRGYQHDDVLRLTADVYRLMAIVYGVGGGKTVTSLAAASLKLEASPSLAIVVVVSQTPIGDQFIHLAGASFAIEGEQHQFPASYTKRCASRAEIKSYLSTRGNRDGRMLVTTYHALLGCEAALREALGQRPVLFIVDEGHHTPQLEEGRDDPRAQKFGHLVSRLHRDYENLSTLKLTGTPYRTDNKPVIEGDAIVCTKRIIELMHEGYAPATVLTDHVTFPASLDDAIEGIARKWVEDGRPTVVIRVKQGLAVVPPLIAALERVGASVVDTTGDGGAEALTAAVRLDDQGLLPRGTVFVTMVRMIEGVNVRTATHAYFWGVPQSMVIVEQLLGRTMRLRVVGDRLDPNNIVPIANVPLDWATKSKVTFFFQETADSDSATDHARLLLRATLFLSTFINPSWVAKQLLGIVDGVPVYRKPSDPVEFLDQRRLTFALEMIEIFCRSEWRERAHEASTITPESQPTLFATSIYNWYVANPGLRAAEDPELSREDILEALFYRLRVAAGAQGPVAAARRSRQLDDNEQLMQDAVNDNIEEFHEATFNGGHYSLWSETVNYWAERVTRDLLERIDGQPKTIDEVFARVRRFHAQNGRLPLPKDEDTAPKKPVPFQRYERLCKAAGHAGLVEFICTEYDPDVSATVRDLLGMAGEAGFLDYTLKQAQTQLQRRGKHRVVAYYWWEAVVAGGRCGIMPEVDTDPFELLRLLDAVNGAYPSRVKLKTVRAAYQERGLAGVRALLEAPRGQANLAQAQH